MPIYFRRSAGHDRPHWLFSATGCIRADQYVHSYISATGDSAAHPAYRSPDATSAYGHALCDTTPTGWYLCRRHYRLHHDLPY